MDTSREIKEDSSFNMTLLILVIGLVGIGGALLFNNIPLFGMIIALPLLCITCILLLKYPWFHTIGQRKGLGLSGGPLSEHRMEKSNSPLKRHVLYMDGILYL